MTRTTFGRASALSLTIGLWVMSAACGSTNISLPDAHTGASEDASSNEVSSDTMADAETPEKDDAAIGESGDTPRAPGDTLSDTQGPFDSSPGPQNDAPAPGSNDADSGDGEGADSQGESAGPHADTNTTLCVAGETECDEQWVIVCGPGGESWTEIVECQGDTTCFQGTCCTPECEGKACGDDGCGGSCGACDQGESCDEGVCACTPQCEGKTCGDDGCGGTCGACDDNAFCDGGVCVCTPECGDAMCGDDGCGGSCGACPSDNACEAGVCIGPCTPGETRCNAGSVEVCNPDGESWTAVATCAESTPCFEGMCCTPVCDGIACGDDGCGGTCGACPEAKVCVEGTCLPGC